MRVLLGHDCAGWVVALLAALGSGCEQPILTSFDPAKDALRRFPDAAPMLVVIEPGTELTPCEPTPWPEAHPDNPGHEWPGLALFVAGSIVREHPSLAAYTALPMLARSTTSYDTPLEIPEGEYVFAAKPWSPEAELWCGGQVVEQVLAPGFGATEVELEYFNSEHTIDSFYEAAAASVEAEGLGTVADIDIALDCSSSVCEPPPCSALQEEQGECIGR